MTGTAMSAEQIERLKIEISDAPRNRALLDDYVTELERHRREEDVFRRLAFENVTPGGVISGPFVVSVYSELYEPLGAEERKEVRKWWHQLMKREASAFQDLRARLLNLPDIAKAATR
jgi:hypothetical protein